MTSATATEKVQDAGPAFRTSNSKLAMWFFLASEVLFFAGLIGAYLMLRMQNPEQFHPSWLETHFHKLDEVLAGLNTLVLITSSYTMVLAVAAVHRKDDAKVRLHLFLTAALGTVFCVVKAFEYKAKFSHGIYPGSHVFFSCYFTLTGVHVLHVIGGIVPLFIMSLVGGKGRFTREGSMTIELMGLYWHFVDLVWIYLFPLLYLIK